MMENTELINKLRILRGAILNPHHRTGEYVDKRFADVVSDAADALEADERRIEVLEAQMPKEAHWVAVDNGHGVCSNCNRQDSIDNMATHCRYCGARMETVTDCHTLDERRTV